MTGPRRRRGRRQSDASSAEGWVDERGRGHGTDQIDAVLGEVDSADEDTAELRAEAARRTVDPRRRLVIERGRLWRADRGDPRRPPSP